MLSVMKKTKGTVGIKRSCYNKALEINADIVIMVHPDYQYTPKLIEPMSYIIANDVYQVVLGSRILGKGALAGGCQFISTSPIDYLRYFKIK